MDEASIFSPRDACGVVVRRRKPFLPSSSEEVSKVSRNVGRKIHQEPLINVKRWATRSRFRHVLLCCSRVAYLCVSFSLDCVMMMEMMTSTVKDRCVPAIRHLKILSVLLSKLTCSNTFVLRKMIKECREEGPKVFRISEHSFRLELERVAVYKGIK